MAPLGGWWGRPSQDFLPPEHIFAYYSDNSIAARIPLVTFPEYVFCTEWCLSWLPDVPVTSRHDVSKWRHFFWERSKLASTHLYDRELWKTEYSMSNFTWTTKYYDDMTWLMTICHHMTYVLSMHDFISIKLNIWLLLYVAVSELERWFYFCFTW